MSNSSTKKSLQSQNLINAESQLSQARKSARNNQNKSMSRKRHCANNCKKHNFQFQPIGYSSFMTRAIEPLQLNFCSKGNTTLPMPVIPYQLMKQPQVPLFILDEEIRKYYDYLSEHKTQFNDFIKKANKMVSSDEEEELLVALPKAKNCQVCRVKLNTDEEYKTHIASAAHKQTIKKSLGQTYIEQEIQELNQRKIEENEAEKKYKEIVQVAQALKQMKRMLKGIMQSLI